MFKTLIVAAAAITVSVFPASEAAAQGNVGQPCANATVMTGSPYYIACGGFYSGNINGSASEESALSTLFGGSWTFRDDRTFNPANNSGTTNVSMFSGFTVLGVKTSNEYSFYLYNLPSPAGTVALLDWQTIGVTANSNNGGAAISHLILYTGEDGPNGQCVTGGTSGCLTSVVPEPSTYALMASGLLGIFGFARRRRNNA